MTTFFMVLILVVVGVLGSVAEKRIPKPAPLVIKTETTPYNDPARIQEIKAELRTQRLQKALTSCDNNGGLKSVSVLETEMSDFSVKKVEITCNNGMGQRTDLDK